MRNVLLAVRVARHSAAAGTTPRWPDDIRDIAALLNLCEDAALRLLRDIEA